MSSAQVYELCKKCNKAIKMRIDFLGKIEIVDTSCDCVRKERELVNAYDRQYKINSKPLRRYYD